MLSADYAEDSAVLRPEHRMRPKKGSFSILATDLLWKLQYYTDSPKPLLFPDTRLLIIVYLTVKYFGNLVRKALGMQVFIIYKG